MNTKIQELKDKIYQTKRNCLVMEEKLAELEKGVPNYTDDDAHRFDVENEFGELEALVLNSKSRIDTLEKASIEDGRAIGDLQRRIHAIENKLSGKWAGIPKPVCDPGFDPSYNPINVLTGKPSRPSWIREDGTTAWEKVPKGTRVSMSHDEVTWDEMDFLRIIFLSPSGRAWNYAKLA